MTPPARQAISHSSNGRAKTAPNGASTTSAAAGASMATTAWRPRGGSRSFAGAGPPAPEIEILPDQGAKARPREIFSRVRPVQPDTMARGCQPVVQFGILVVAEARVIAAHRPKGVDPHQA